MLDGVSWLQDFLGWSHSDRFEHPAALHSFKVEIKDRGHDPATTHPGFRGRFAQKDCWGHSHLGTFTEDTFKINDINGRAPVHLWPEMAQFPSSGSILDEI